MSAIYHAAMNENQIGPEPFQAGSGDPDIMTLGRVRSRPRRAAALAGVAMVALAGGAGAAYAAVHSPGPRAADTAAVSSAASPSPSASPTPRPGGRRPGPFGGSWRGFGFGGWSGLGIGSGAIVHGQVVVPKSGGGYQTLDVQKGQVTSVTSTSVTVKSSDGYTATYVVTSSTVVDAKAAGIGSVKTGDTVDLTATVSGSTATAASITDLTAIKAGRASSGFPAAPPAWSPS